MRLPRVNHRGWLRWACLLGLLVAEWPNSRGQPPDFFKAQRIGDDLFALAIRPRTNSWVTLESSVDLRAWSELASIATTNDVSVFVDDRKLVANYCFYRLRRPGTSVEQAVERWKASGAKRYRFHLQRAALDQGPVLLSGNVVIDRGRKEITNAEADGRAQEQPNLELFPSVDELFAALQAAEGTGSRRVDALFDAVLGYPVRCSIDRRSATPPLTDPGYLVQYWIRDLEILE
jgi:Family of unknown function (DUF6174)